MAVKVNMPGSSTSELDHIVELLERNEQPATYGAVGGVVGVHHKVVMAGRPRNPRNSWVVDKKTRVPTDYEPHEIHPTLARAVQEKRVIETPEELDEWLADQAEREWDEQIERDERAGRLDALIDRALEEHRAGRTRPL
ncbi:MAG TPA: hypothetical protein VF590_08250 [Isosphaeraceae bacterium]